MNSSSNCTNCREGNLCKVYNRPCLDVELCGSFDPYPSSYFICYVQGQNFPKVRHDTFEIAKAEAERLVEKTNQEVFVIEVKNIHSCKPIKVLDWKEIMLP